MKIRFRYQYLDRPVDQNLGIAQYDNPEHAWAELTMLDTDGATISDIMIDGRYATREHVRLLAEQCAAPTGPVDGDTKS
jgi:hypothetical protein